MRRTILFSFVLCSFLAACGGGGAATNAPGGQTSAPGQPTNGGVATSQPTTGVQPTTGGQPTTAGQPGAGTVSVVLTGGDHAGTYTGTDNPNCTYNFFAPDTWGTQFSLTEATPAEFSSLQIVHRPDGGGSEGDMFPGVATLVTVGFGSLLEPDYTVYEVELRADDEESEIGGEGTMTVNDAGSTAVLHFTGTTADGVGIDATVNCPSVTRG